MAFFGGGGETDRVVLDSGFVLLLVPELPASEGSKTDEEEESASLALGSSSSSASDTAGVRLMTELLSRLLLRSPFSRSMDALDVTVGSDTGNGARSCENKQFVSLHAAGPLGHGICLKSSEENIFVHPNHLPYVAIGREYRCRSHAYVRVMNSCPNDVCTMMWK